MNLGSAGHRRAIESALLDFQRSPGKFALAGKQPPLLFASVTEILQLASGRSPDGLEQAAPTPEVQGAAGFFIRSALLCPEADHYALLGLERGADAAAVKDRYRLMMRLVHPDFSGSLAGQSWPADAASRLNQAYEVLSSLTQRRTYDEQLDVPPPSRPFEEVRPPRSFKPAPQRSSRDAHRSLKRLAAGFGAAGALAALALLYAGMAGEKESLVQRTIGERATAIVASLSDAPAVSSPAPAATTQPRAPLAAPTAPAAPAVATAVQPEALGPAPVVAMTAASAAAPAAPAQPAIASRTASGAANSPVEAAPPQPGVAAPAIPSATPEKSMQLAGPQTTTASLPPALDARPAVNPGVTLAEVHPLLSKLLQRMESGSGDQVLDLLERDARTGQAAQALLRDYDNLVDGGYPVKVSNVQFKSEPRQGRLLVTGHVMLQVGSAPQGGKPFAVQAEFASREGTVVMTRLARAQGH